jgi:hypothetical protein
MVVSEIMTRDVKTAASRPTLRKAARISEVLRHVSEPVATESLAAFEESV